MDFFSRYATDESLEENGTWREVGGGAELLVARSGNRGYSKELSRQVEQHREVLDVADDAADKKSDEIMVSVLSKTVLKGWRRKLNGEYTEAIVYRKKELPFTIENAAMMLKHKDFRKLVVGLSEQIETYLMKEETEQGEA